MFAIRVVFGIYLSVKYTVKFKQNNSSMCFICGLENKSGVKMRFYACEDENKNEALIGTIKQHAELQSYPNRMHGGVISAILDESIGRAVQISHPEIWGVTVDLNVKFKKPVPLNQTIYSVTKVTTLSSRLFDGAGEIVDESGNVLATATGRFMILPIEKIATEMLDHANWFMEEGTDNTTSFNIGE